jgi:aconitate hydratase
MERKDLNPFGARARFAVEGGDVEIHRLDALERDGGVTVSDLPFSIKVLLEAVLRNLDGEAITEDHVNSLARWGMPGGGTAEVPFRPARVLMQDFTGVPGVVDLAAMRSAMKALGGDPRRINPLIPVDLVIDHSVQVDHYGTAASLEQNAQREFERNGERYSFLRWGGEAFDDFRVVPPATGIVHQVNLEYLAQVVQVRDVDGVSRVFPDTLVGTDSHTTMINALGVAGWGVGGIEAEAAMLGQPVFMLPPAVVGFELTGRLPEGATATDLVLTIVEQLRAHGVVGKFVEFHGGGLASMSLADRATVANMAPEYGATMGFFPVDKETLRYLRGTGRDAQLVDLVERYCKEQGLFHSEGSVRPRFSEELSLDMGTVVPCLAGPRRPQDRVPLASARDAFRSALKDTFKVQEPVSAPVSVGGRDSTLHHGSVVIAAITSCTNTSNPSVMLGAGLLAKKAVEKGLRTAPHVKTSLAPGSRVVTRYMEEAGVLPALADLGFQPVGYGCTTCIGNSGPLPEAVADAIGEKSLVAAAVLSGNRNFEGRISPHVKANYLASPPLVVAYALAGTMDLDLNTEPLGTGTDGQPVYLRDIWPSADEVREAVNASLNPEIFREEYSSTFTANETWNAIPVTGGDLYEWEDGSSYIREPSFFADLQPSPAAPVPLKSARALLMLGDSITTDHISPAGAIPADGPAGQYLQEQGVAVVDFNSFGSRRGNHEVMVRGTFANIRIRNQLAPGTEGGVTRHLPGGDVTSVYEAAMRYAGEKTPLIVLAGREYGTGSSRDWAAKGTFLLGVKAVLTESYERIHRSNLIGMGVLPLEYSPGDSASGLGLTGEEEFDILAMGQPLTAGQKVQVSARGADGSVTSFTAVVRLDSPTEAEYYRQGGILQKVLRDLLED